MAWKTAVATYQLGDMQIRIFKTEDGRYIYCLLERQQWINFLPTWEVARWQSCFEYNRYRLTEAMLAAVKCLNAYRKGHFDVDVE